jgi:hypothetical protein
MEQVVVPVSTSRNGEGHYLTQAVAEMRTWSALTFSPTPDTATITTQGVHASQRIEILRLLGPSTARLHLTTSVIDRLHDLLRSSGQIEPSTDPGWVIIRVDTPSEVDLLLTLVSVAIKANIEHL